MQVKLKVNYTLKPTQTTANKRYNRNIREVEYKKG
jgi:hypothetical protein